jgi:sarcosine oxidase/L-pipecolate oxidase
MGLKHWRAADPDGLWAEQLQAAWEHSPLFRQQLHGVVLLALQHGMPAAAKEAEALPLFKKGDASNPGNYRCIQLVSMLRKVVALVLSRQLRALGEQRLLEHQCGFRPQRGCSDQMFSLRRLSELALAKQRQLYIAFVDLCKAFDSVNRDALWAVLRASGLPEGPDPRARRPPHRHHMPNPGG